MGERLENKDAEVEEIVALAIEWKNAQLKNRSGISSTQAVGYVLVQRGRATLRELFKYLDENVAVFNLPSYIKQNPTQQQKLSEACGNVFAGILTTQIESAFWEKDGWSTRILLERWKEALVGTPIPTPSWEDLYPLIDKNFVLFYSDKIQTSIIRERLDIYKNAGYFFEKPNPNKTTLEFLKPVMFILSTYGHVFTQEAIEAGKLAGLYIDRMQVLRPH